MRLLILVWSNGDRLNVITESNEVWKAGCCPCRLREADFSKFRAKHNASRPRRSSQNLTFNIQQPPGRAEEYVSRVITVVMDRFWWSEKKPPKHQLM